MTVPPLTPATLGLLHKAQGELARRRFDEAAATLSPLLISSPDCVPALSMAGVAAQMQGRHDSAIELFRKALALEPRDARFHAGLGISLFESGDIAGAIVALQRACELAPNVPGGWYNLGRALKLQVRADEAIEALQRALRLDPSHVTARLTLADAQASIGEIHAAAAELRRLLKAHPDQAHAWFALANLKVVPLSPEDVALLRRNFDQTGTPAEDRVLFGFALAKALEDQGDYGASFRVLKRANRLQRETLRWDASAHTAYTNAIARTFEAQRTTSADSESGRGVILIASLPRSGSSLVEQILASHPEVEGANEISDLSAVVEAESDRQGRRYPEWAGDAPPDTWQRLGSEYLARTVRWREHKPRFVDKNLANWHLVGPALAMLPAARVVLVHRDPLETCLACYRQWFSKNTPFAYDLDELVAYCADFRLLSRFWLQRYPDRVFDLKYEALLAEPETVIRRLLDFCQLPFDATCLAPHQTRRTIISAASAAQVRQPLQLATARAQRYGALLNGLRQRLRDAGLEDRDRGVAESAD